PCDWPWSRSVYTRGGRAVPRQSRRKEGVPSWLGGRTRGMAATVAPPRTPSPLDRRFRFTERRTTLRTEALGGLSTFLTMSYILFVNPAILSAAKVPAAVVAVATALAAALLTAAMGLIANMPFALAPGLGINAVVAFDIVLAQGHPWPVAMSCIVLEGVLALVLVLAGLRE